jgi:predicted enzyme related to lactoylglutathione lyase
VRPRADAGVASRGSCWSTSTSTTSRARAFYTRALGLTVGRRFGADGVELLGASSAIYLLPKPAGSAPFANGREQRRYDRHWTPVHLDFVVEDLVAARDRAVAAGALLEADLAEATWGSIAMFADPFGNGFCLVQFTARGYDAIAA